MPAMRANDHPSGMTVAARLQLRHGPCQPLRVPRRAHLGVEAVGLVELAGLLAASFDLVDATFDAAPDELGEG